MLSPVWNRAKITVLNEARTIFGHNSPSSFFNDFLVFSNDRSWNHAKVSCSIRLPLLWFKEYWVSWLRGTKRSEIFWYLNSQKTLSCCNVSVKDSWLRGTGDRNIFHTWISGNPLSLRLRHKNTQWLYSKIRMTYDCFKSKGNYMRITGIKWSFYNLFMN